VQFERETYKKTNNKVLFNSSNSNISNDSKEQDSNKNLVDYGDRNYKSEADFD
jgi:hypothetical protein